MSLPEGYLPRKGDEVLIRARAKRDSMPNEPDIECYFEIVGNEHKNFFMSASEVHSLYRRHWNEGDRVREVGDHEMVGPIVAIFEGWVWVKIDKGDSAGAMLTFSANEIEAEPEAIDTMTEAELLAGLKPLILPESVSGSQSVVGDDEEIKF